MIDGDNTVVMNTIVDEILEEIREVLPVPIPETKKSKKTWVNKSHSIDCWDGSSIGADIQNWLSGNPTVYVMSHTVTSYNPTRIEYDPNGNSKNVTDPPRFVISIMYKELINSAVDGVAIHSGGGF